VIRTRSGDAYEPSALRAYNQALQHRVLRALGQKRLTGISTNMLQDLADGLAAAIRCKSVRRRQRRHRRAGRTLKRTQRQPGTAKVYADENAVRRGRPSASPVGKRCLTPNLNGNRRHAGPVSAHYEDSAGREEQVGTALRPGRAFANPSCKQMLP
jgi:hypothetical protein